MVYWCNIARVTIDMLPDVALLRIFDFYMGADEDQIDAWHTLVHVSREWRNIVFGSPHRLDLQLLCTNGTPVRKMLDVWPLLPISVRTIRSKSNLDNILAALEHNDRIRQLQLHLTMRPSGDASRIQLQEQIWVAMQQPFPALTNLQFWFHYGLETWWVADRDSFLGGSAPSLRTLLLDSIPFLGLPKILLSATHLVDLHLREIPLSPEEMLSAFSTLTKLEKIYIETSIDMVQSGRHPPQLTRTLLPALTTFEFKGFYYEYFEYLAAGIDTPLLDDLDITFLDYSTVTSDYPQLIQLISRTPKFKAQDRARVVFDNHEVWVTLPQTSNGRLSLGLSSFLVADWHLWSLTPVCKPSFPQSLLLAVEHLYLFGPSLGMAGCDDWKDREWVEIFRPFPAVKSLYICYSFASKIARSLEELVGERVTEVLPALESLFIEEMPPLGPIQEAFGLFVVARQLSGRPITVCRWEGVRDVWKDEFRSEM